MKRILWLSPAWPAKGLSSTDSIFTTVTRARVAQSKTLKEFLGLDRVICFGDSDNDLSMFEAADESYAPANANDMIKAAATAIIGHHDEEGIVRFPRERFALYGS